LDGVVGFAIDHNAAVHEPRVLPLAGFAAVMQHAVFEIAAQKLFPVQAYRFSPKVTFSISVTNQPYSNKRGLEEKNSQFLARNVTESWLEL
jgi:hypothetical protein